MFPVVSQNNNGCHKLINFVCISFVEERKAIQKSFIKFMKEFNKQTVCRTMLEVQFDNLCNNDC